MTHLLGGGDPILLWCRWSPSRQYIMCGRLKVVALGLPSLMAGDGSQEHRPTGQSQIGLPHIPIWRTTAVEGSSPPADHVIFQMMDAHNLLLGREAELLAVLLSKSGDQVPSLKQPRYYNLLDAGRDVTDSS